MVATRSDFGLLLMRVALGAMVLLHGIAKITGGIVGIQQMLVGHGLPAALAYGAYFGEVAGPLLLIVGWQARIGAALVALNMVVAIWLAHAGELLKLNGTGGWAIELQAMFLLVALGLLLTGPGRISLDTR
jgi:putative oxidoreductase